MVFCNTRLPGTIHAFSLAARSPGSLMRRQLVAWSLVVASLAANPALAQPAKPKNGPLGMKLVAA